MKVQSSHDKEGRRSATARLRSSAVLVAVALALSACTGSGGNVVTEDRPVGEFDSLYVDGALNVAFTVDPDTDPTVSITYGEDVQDKITAEVREGVLVLDLDGIVNISGSDQIINVTMNTLESLTVDGASGVRGSGEMDSYKLVVSGASDVNLENLIAIDVDVEVDGASEVNVFVSGVISGSASGVSDIVVFGDPASVLVETSLADVTIK